MDLSIISVGNSKGIILPKTVLEKYNITDKVELILKKGYIILKPKSESCGYYGSISASDFGQTVPL